MEFGEKVISIKGVTVWAVNRMKFSFYRKGTTMNNTVSVRVRKNGTIELMDLFDAL